MNKNTKTDKYGYENGRKLSMGERYADIKAETDAGNAPRENKCERCGKAIQSSLPHCATCHRELWTGREGGMMKTENTSVTDAGNVNYGRREESELIKAINIGK